MIAFRLRLGSFWLSQLCRVLADNWLRLFVVLELAGQPDHPDQNAWHVVTALWTLPAVVLAPFNGAICNSLPKPRVLLGAAFLGFVAVLMGSTLPVSWVVCWTIVALSFALYGPARYALYPAASQDTQLALPRLNGLFEMGSAGAVVAGVLLAAHFGLAVWQGVFVAGICAAGLQLLATAFALPVFFPSDVRRSESAGQAVLGFFRDSGRVWRQRETRGCLIGLACLRALITAFTGAVLANHFSIHGGELPERLLELGLWVGVGVAAGSLLVSLQKHPWRVLGLVPWGATGFTMAVALAACGMNIGPVLCVILGVTFALVNVPLSSAFQGFAPADARGNAMAVRNFCDYGLTTILVGTLYLLGLSAGVQLGLLAVLAAVATLLCWNFFLREVIELGMEWLLWPLYRVSMHGPGRKSFPREGPVLLVANHSSYLDPLWMAKVLPRRFIPMMTSVFYDKPVLRYLMIRFVQAIRVQAAHYRRDVPELFEAVTVLDQNQIVLVFPEGSMRKREERPLKQFGQGVWHILQERPNVPVVVCWIEGGWGSYFSYYNGLPAKNKKLDFWRGIRIAVDEPHVIPPEILADLRATRLYLMQRCLQARTHLGLPALGMAAVEDEEENQ